MQLRIVTKDGVETTLNCTSIVSIDGTPYNEVVKSAGLDLDTLNRRLTITESALASMLEQWQEFMTTAVLVEPAKHGE